MKTRCQSGDPCLVLTGFPLVNLGTEITVTRLGLWMGEPAWEYDGHVDDMNGNGERAFMVLDRCLLPLGRVVDETAPAGPVLLDLCME